MTYAGERICCDADSHIMETFDWLKSYADPDVREALPALALGGAGKAAEKAIARANAARSTIWASAASSCSPLSPRRNFFTPRKRR
jgi:hypothetical protein